MHSIMRHVAETTACNLEQLYADVAWPLYRLYGHAYNAFATMVTGARPLPGCGGLLPSHGVRKQGSHAAVAARRHAEVEADAVFKRLVDEVHSGQAPEVLTQAVKDGILVNIRCGQQ